MKKHLIPCSVLLLLTAAVAFSQEVITAQIPFQFHIGESVLPSGSYTVDNHMNHSVLLFRSAHGAQAAMIFSNAVQSTGIPSPPKLVFNRYGEQYFLAQVWLGNSGAGRELPRSRHEKELAATTKPTTTTLLATK